MKVNDITVITYGLFPFCLQAAEKLRVMVFLPCIRSYVQSIHWIKRRLWKQHGRREKYSGVHEDNKEGGIGGEVSAIIAEECLYELDAPIKRLGGPDVPAGPFNGIMEKFFMLNPDKVYEAMKELAQY